MTDPKAIENNPFKELGEIPEKKYTDGYTVDSTYITVRDALRLRLPFVSRRDFLQTQKSPQF